MLYHHQKKKQRQKDLSFDILSFYINKEVALQRYRESNNLGFEELEINTTSL